MAFELLPYPAVYTVGMSINRRTDWKLQQSLTNSERSHSEVTLGMSGRRRSDDNLT
jgi:hypothetical protein